MSVLIVSAWPPELAALRAWLRRERGLDVITAAAGVGLVESAAGTTRLLAEHRPRAVVFVGTAGLYPARAALKVGQAIVARPVRLLSSAVEAGQAYWPAPLPTSCAMDARLSRLLARAGGVDQASTGSPLGITRTTALARRFARAVASENLEVFAVARAAAQARVPCAAVLGLSNVVGPRAHAEWRQNAAAASAAACEVVRAWLSTRSHSGTMILR